MASALPWAPLESDIGIEGQFSPVCFVMCRGRSVALHAASDVWQWLSRMSVKAPAAEAGGACSSPGELPCQTAQLLCCTHQLPLQAITLRCRKAAAAYVATAAAAHSAKGGSTLHHCPEMMLQFVVQHLAHHPDFPIMQVS